MRIFTAALAVFFMACISVIPTASAGQVKDGVSYNINVTDWESVDCNEEGSKLICPLNGAGGDGPGESDGEGDGGKH